MESTAPSTANIGSLARTITKILRFRRNATTCSDRCSDHVDEVYKLKPSKTVQEYPSILTEPINYNSGKVEDEKKQQQQPPPQPEAASSNNEAIEALLANLFASISAIKASYAQLQVAQSPYDPETIQSSDQAVVSELKHLSELKQLYFKNQLAPQPPPPPMVAQIQEHRNILKTYQITTKKLETEFQAKDSEIFSLQSQLMELDRQNRFLESRLHPGRTLSCLDDLHLSGLDPTHFLAAVRFTVRSIKSFAKLVMLEMESAGWDLDAAAISIQPDVHLRPNHLNFAFESFICQKMFSGFQDRNFGLSALDGRSSWEQRQFFVEFTESKSAKLKQFVSGLNGISPGLRKFCRARYLSLVHPKMETSFFGDLDQRELVSSGRGFPETQFFMGFAEMARRVWLMHNLFFSFGRETEGSIFQIRRGCLFSEVYMESVVEDEVYGAGVRPTVGFTVVPGFRVGKTVIQCKVYASDSTSRRS